MKILSAAIRIGNLITSLPQPNRHKDICAILFSINPLLDLKDRDFGFLTDTGKFANREEAASIAIEAAQLLPGRYVNPVGGKLYSEDLW